MQSVLVHVKLLSYHISFTTQRSLDQFYGSNWQESDFSL